MSVLRNLETKLADLVEGTFGRVFRSEVRPVELARKLAREMDEHKTVSVSRTYVPNEYVVWLSPEDRERFEEVEDSLIEELSGYLLEHARRERLALLSRPQIEFRTDERLALGEFGIQTRLVRPAGRGAGDAAQQAVQADHGNTMIYSTAGRIRGPVEEAQGTRPTRALLSPRAGGTSSRRAARRSAAAATATSSWPTRTSRAATPRCGRPPPARGRSPTSARRTACSSTGAASRAREPLTAGRPHRARHGRDRVRARMTAAARTPPRRRPRRG